MEFKDRVRSLRDAAGLTQEQLADRVGLTGRAIGAWESGRAKPRIDKLQQLADYFGVSPHWLLDGDAKVELTASELELLNLFRSCSDVGRGVILDSARSAAARMPRGEAQARVGRSA